jgi:hypothetical protein
MSVNTPACQRGTTDFAFWFVLRVLLALVLPCVAATEAPAAQRTAPPPDVPKPLPAPAVNYIKPNPFDPGREVTISLSTGQDWDNMSVTFNGQASPRVYMRRGDVYATAPTDLPLNSQINIILSGPIQTTYITAFTNGPNWTLIVGGGLAGALIIGAVAFAWQKSRESASLSRKLNQSRDQLDQTRFDFNQMAEVDSVDMRPPPLPVPSIPEELVSACLNRNVVLVAGGGVAIMAGRPSWQETLAQLILMVDGSANSSWTADALAQVKKRRYDFALGAVQSRSDAKQIITRLTELFGTGDDQQDRSDQQERIVKLLEPIPLAGAINCTLDNTVARLIRSQNVFGRAVVSFDASTRARTH